MCILRYELCDYYVVFVFLSENRKKVLDKYRYLVVYSSIINRSFMTLQEIIVEALHDPQNWKDGEVDWNWIDSDLWLHPIAQEHTDEELFDALNNFPEELVPVWGEFTPRVTHPLP